ncbi:MAG: toll/interleukin-1 receptor domain-containing protein [Alcanivorax jadensis]|uniref:toll/interleukin-1 receptor domain-containing protein n=1 Tax=Alcanivorax jadensis TaxID=64988 RepID=UPI003003710B
MPDVFISYSVKDEKLARFVREHLLQKELDVFLASISINQGEHWTPQIFEALKASDWVFLLASKSAMESPNVQQEMGAAISHGKKVVPIMWDMQPGDLPRWIADFQGLILSGATMDNINLQMSQLAERVKSNKVKGQLVAGAVFAGLLYFLAN